QRKERPTNSPKSAVLNKHGIRLADLMINIKKGYDYYLNINGTTQGEYRVAGWGVSNSVDKHG
ncbi:MAG TPA: hypothetical protein VJ964_09140, partial [Balneolaceae bacterium]|nr:hypothetical protein [Balneolaceae bacterium]